MVCLRARPRDLAILDAIGKKIGVDRSNAIRVSFHHYAEFLGLQFDANTPA